MEAKKGMDTVDGLAVGAGVGVALLLPLCSRS